MFGRHLFRSLRGAWGPGSGAAGWGRRPPAGAGVPGPRRLFVASASAGSAFVQMLSRAPHTAKLAGGAVVGGGAAMAMNAGAVEEPGESAELAWVQELASEEGTREVHMPGNMLRKHPVGQLLSEDDHLFENMKGSKQIKEFRCFYNHPQQTFHSVIVLGREVCGYPSTVHGGLTAAIVDETLGGLYTSMLTNGALGASLPGMTARLEVDYKRPVPAGSTLLCTARLEATEGRKVWMAATVSDGAGIQYASGRALFVAPNVGRKLQQALGMKGAPAANTAHGSAAA